VVCGNAVIPFFWSKLRDGELFEVASWDKAGEATTVQPRMSFRVHADLQQLNCVSFDRVVVPFEFSGVQWVRGARYVVGGLS
jgi:hypothetical protein